ncbi:MULTISPECIES: MarR family transcriptional regulator [unclassified Curtobacterium]|uniref:MarR family winged helix-turn-helix transcriptional regulator n=1 Tax=unclassified Curtobacterium TaxID=257496 RepID=UPI000D968C0B|nr:MULTISPECIES: MarR family transcriptional regulator [unclassified Curtobacterium]PYY63535.1 MarR family transcriptional regulator [Curtobacterium sp. MCPF17_003]PZE69412.1 MarR family transcriptional regulator [Curtobacterium sp. MCPF17_018]PZF28532.1 MarR family transcriptional regulator [Curtobacterium sp. MCPF17_051]WIB70884.1 MarR family transcriptional regulator [Curtobacterium sp. MCBD17_026]
MPTDLEALGHAVKRAQYRNHRTMDAALRDLGVTLVQWDALRAIDRMPRASGHDLAVATFQSDQAFGTLANRMLGRGLITRTAGRGRRIEHTVTEDGRRVLEEGHRIAEGVLDGLFAPLDEPRRAALLQLLTTLTDGPEPFGAQNVHSANGSLN